MSNSNHDFLLFCLLRSYLNSNKLHPVDRICLRNYLSELEFKLSKLPHWNEAFHVNFEDDPMDIPLVKSLRSKILDEITTNKIIINKNQNNDDLLESFESWLYGSGAKSPLSAKDLTFLLASNTFTNNFYENILEVVNMWEKSQLHDDNRRNSPDFLDDVINACGYFLEKARTN